MINAHPRGHRLYADIERDFGPGMVHTIFDVGANVGQTALHYAREFPDAIIHCFEPEPEAFKRLKVNVAALEERCGMHKLALSRTSGSATLNVNPDTRLSSLVHRRPEDKRVTVRTATLDDFCRWHKVEHIDLLKIDTEGHEIEVLEGARRMLAENRVGFVQVETAPLEGNGYFVGFNEILSWMEGDEEFRFELYGIYDQTIDFTGRQALLFANLVFVNARMIKPTGWLTVSNR